jgi:hypothetical protein
MEGRFAMTGQKIPADSRLARVHRIPRPLPGKRNAVELEQLFFAGMLVAMLVVQVAGFVATYIFLAQTSQHALWPTPPSPPVMVEISP